MDTNADKHYLESCDKAELLGRLRLTLFTLTIHRVDYVEESVKCLRHSLEFSACFNFIYLF